MAGRSGFDYRQQRDMHVLRRTMLKSGTGLFVPLYDGVLASIFLVGGGGSGGYVNSNSGGGGVAGAFVAVTAPLFIGAKLTYVVGAGGSIPALESVGNSGGTTYFGPFMAEGGAGGAASVARSTGSCSQATLGGAAGGYGGQGLNDSLSLAYGGFPGSGANDIRQVPLYVSGTYDGCGGSSVFGFGADSTTGATGYGAGGKGGKYASTAPTPGAGGCIVIFELEG